MKYLIYTVFIVLFFPCVAFMTLKNDTYWQTFSPHFQRDKNTNNAKLLVFYQSDNQLFIKETLPKLQQYCKDKKIDLIEKNASEGIPEELTSTPALVFQNAKGRSIYAARYATFSTIENFIRTSRAFPQKGNGVIEKSNVLLHTEGKMNIATALKITPLSGVSPKDFDNTIFEKNIAKSIDKAMQQFDYLQKESFGQSLVQLKKTDRIFYLDIHPFAEKTGKVFLTYELYAQFSCTEPIFTKLKTPLVTDFEHIGEAAETIGKTIENEIFAHLKNATNGDAYTAISAATPIKNWADFGFGSMPNQDKNLNKNEEAAAVNLHKNWTYAGAIDSETPLMAFHFQAPLDRYAGEVKEIKGTMQINENQALTGGNFEVNTASLTMGIADFDEKIHDKYIKIKRYPTAMFSFSGQQIPLQMGKTSDANIVGDFTLMGKKIPVTMQTQLTPSKNDKGITVIVVQAAFNLNITDDFNIKGPDGPDPAKKNMEFFMNFCCE
jgi:polyisoprenoid-binding protein YceI